MGGYGQRRSRDAMMAGRFWSIEVVSRGYDMLKTAIPVIHVSDSVVAEEFYCKGLGFNLLSSWRPHKANHDPCYMVLVRDNAHLHLTSFKDGMVGAWTSTVYVFVDDIDALHAVTLIETSLILDSGSLRANPTVMSLVGSFRHLAARAGSLGLSCRSGLMGAKRPTQRQSRGGLRVRPACFL